MGFVGFAKKKKLPLAAVMVLLLSMTTASAWSQQADATTSASRSSAEAVSSASRSTAADATTSASRSPGAPRKITSVLYDAGQGPVLRLSLLAAALGILYRIWQFRRLTRTLRKRPSFAVAATAATAATVAHGRTRRGVVTHPLMRTVSLSFHVLLFVVPLFLPAHTMIVGRSLHASLPSLPSPVADWLTIVLVCLGGFFLARRLFVPRVRVLSTIYDYAILLLVLGPFLTGLMAYHHVSSSPWLMIAHVASGDLLLAAIPFTKLGHMPFLLFSRLFVSGEYAWRPGKRAWGGGA
jgi:nitrate reductase gamma subunit